MRQSTAHRLITFDNLNLSFKIHESLKTFKNTGDNRVYFDGKVKTKEKRPKGSVPISCLFKKLKHLSFPALGIFNFNRVPFCSQVFQKKILIRIHCGF